jgi:hypothetical protein
MKRLDPGRLSVTYLTGTTPEYMSIPRCYTLTHSDRTGMLFLSIGSEFNMKQTAGLYVRLMRDEILAELSGEQGSLSLNVYCHVSGGFVIGTARWRYGILQSEMQLVLETIRYGDRILFDLHPELDSAEVLVHFKSTNSRFNKVENWGTMREYR